MKNTIYKKEVAKILGIGNAQIDKLIEKGDLKVISSSGWKTFDKESVLAYRDTANFQSIKNKGCLLVYLRSRSMKEIEKAKRKAQKFAKANGFKCKIVIELIRPNIKYNWNSYKEAVTAIHQKGISQMIHLDKTQDTEEIARICEALDYKISHIDNIETAKRSATSSETKKSTYGNTQQSLKGRFAII